MHDNNQMVPYFFTVLGRLWGLTGGEKAIGDISVKGRHLSSAAETWKCQKKQWHFWITLLWPVVQFLRMLLQRVIFDIILTIHSSTRVSISQATLCAVCADQEPVSKTHVFNVLCTHKTNVWRWQHQYTWYTAAVNKSNQNILIHCLSTKFSSRWTCLLYVMYGIYY